LQTTNTILLIRPSNFGFNKETAANNAFQINSNETQTAIQKKALQEFDHFAEQLKNEGVTVRVIQDSITPVKPDAIFPNNWGSFHADGKLILYPMFAPNRRLEKQTEIIALIQQKFQVTKLIDLSHFEKENRFLEGTGSIIFDRVNKIGYACLSPRTDQELFVYVCNLLNYKAVYFHAEDTNGKAIYHSNVMMCLGEKFSVICLASISNQQERTRVTQSLSDTGHEIIDISFEQMNQFAGNMLEIKSNERKNLLVLSKSAFDCLKLNQKERLSSYCKLVPIDIKTIEHIGGGSARCMVAELFLQPI